MLIDSNILIYAAQPEHAFLREFIAEHAPVVSAVSYVEVLGFPWTNQRGATALRGILRRVNRSADLSTGPGSGCSITPGASNGAWRCSGCGHLHSERPDLGHPQRIGLWMDRKVDRHNPFDKPEGTSADSSA